MRRITLFVVVLAAAAAASAQEKSGKAAKKKSNKAAKTAAKDLDPIGKPDTALAARLGPKTARYYLWFDDGAWHIRTTANNVRQFHGTIRVKEGRIASCVSTGLRRDPKANRDAWRVNESRDTLTFEFKTSRASDGFDLKVEGEAAELEFTLLIGTEKRPQAVFVGREQQHPGEMPFRLKTPAEPARKP